MKYTPLCLVCLLGGLAGPASGAVAATNDAPWTTMRLSREVCGPDDWESFNRAMYWFNDTGMTWFGCPLSWVYGSIVPRPLVKGIDNAVDNIEWPIRLFATLFRGEGRAAWHETERFFINTTVGLGGLFDPAIDLCGIVGTDASFSGTFAAWGMPKGKSLLLPFVPRANVRDTAGYFCDWAFDPKTYFNLFFPTGAYIGWSATTWPNNIETWIDPWERMMPDQADGYRTFRQLVAAKSYLDEDLVPYRYATDLIGGTAVTRRPPERPALAKPVGLKGRWREVPGYAPRTPAFDSLREVFFVPRRSDDFWWMPHSVFNRDFAHDVQVRAVRLAAERPAARYGFVPAPADAPAARRNRLVIVVPGVGGCYDSMTTRAMAELVRDAGAAVVLCDDPFDWHYMQSVNLGVLPGHLPSDAQRFVLFARALLADLKAAGLADDPEVSLVGWSMGGLLATHVAALAGQGDLGFRTGTFLAVNPPVESATVSETLASFLAPSRAWSAEEAREHFRDVTSRILVWSKLGAEAMPDISEEDARMTIALTLDAVLPGLVAQSGRTNADVSVSTYITTHLAEEYPSLSLEELRRASGLRSLEPVLRGNGALVMIHTRDDFILDDADRRYLDETLGERITWFPVGAHCGEFYTPEFRDEVLVRLGLPGSSK